MRFHGHSVRFHFAAVFVLAAMMVLPLAAATPNGVPDPPPTKRIDVTPLGYMAPSRFYLIYRFSSTTLDFIDDDHLLFTFRHNGLIERVPDAQKDDDDQVIRALVIEVSSGKVVREAKWRMHDRQAYLWSLGNGKFMIRRRNDLFLTDSTLELQPYFNFDTDVQSVEMSPDRKLLMIELARFAAPKMETKAEGDAADKPAPTLVPDAPKAAPTLGPDAPKEPPTLGLDAPTAASTREKWTQILMYRTADKALVAKSEARHPIDLPLLPDGFLDALEGKPPDRWVLRMRPFHDDPKVLGEFRSACTPTAMTLSESVVFFVGCIDGTGDHAVTALSTDGSVLWQDRWQQRYIWPTFDFASNGSRFAYGSLDVNHPIGTMDPFDETDVAAQMVGVFDTASGKLRLVKSATPILSAGHNYALSGDGQRFAILRDGSIEVYDLPPVGSAVPAENRSLSKPN